MAATHLDPDEELRALGLEPLSPHTRVGDLRSCLCSECGTVRHVRLSNLRKGGTACRWCSGWAKWGPWGDEVREMSRSWRDLGTPAESLALLGAVHLAPITPLVDLFQAVGAVCLQCRETMVVVPERIAASRARPGWYDCQRCAADRKRQIREDAPTFFADHGLRLLSPARGEYTPQQAECVTCGSERWVSYNDLLNGLESRCWPCATGISPHDPHRAYLVHFDALGVYKIGITHNRDDGRLAAHALEGGRLIEYVVVPTRGSALKLERVVRAIHEQWRVSNVGPFDFPQGGWTKTWSDKAPPLKLKELAAALGVAHRISPVLPTQRRQVHSSRSARSLLTHRHASHSNHRRSAWAGLARILTHSSARSMVTLRPGR